MRTFISRFIISRSTRRCCDIECSHTVHHILHLHQRHWVLHPTYWIIFVRYRAGFGSHIHPRMNASEVSRYSPQIYTPFWTTSSGYSILVQWSSAFPCISSLVATVTGALALPSSTLDLKLLNLPILQDRSHRGFRLLIPTSHSDSVRLCLSLPLPSFLFLFLFPSFPYYGWLYPVDSVVLYLR